MGKSIVICYVLGMVWFFYSYVLYKYVGIYSCFSYLYMIKLVKIWVWMGVYKVLFLS